MCEKSAGGMEIAEALRFEEGEAVKRRFTTVCLLVLTIFACNLIDNFTPDESETFEEVTVTERPASTAPPEIANSPAGSTAKWDLWSGSTRLRGVDLHPCNTDDHQVCTVPINRQDIQDLRDLGANLINASYPGVFSPEPPYEIDTAALEHLDNLISWAEEVGIYVVIHYRTGPGRNESAIHLYPDALYDVWSDQAAHDAFIEMWRFTAERYRDSPVVVGYDLMVEPHVNTIVDPDYEMEAVEYREEVEGTLMDWNAFARDMTVAIRALDPNTPIIVSSLSWGDPEWFAVLDPTGDPKTVYSFHAYEPTEYTHQEEDAIQYNYPDEISNFWESIQFDRDWLEAYFQPVVEFSTTYDVPIYVGEFGAMRWVPNADAFLRDEVGIFEERGWNYAYYVWRGDEEYFDGFNLEYGPDPEIHTIDLDNPVMIVFLDRWAQNALFPDVQP